MGRNHVHRMIERCFFRQIVSRANGGRTVLKLLRNGDAKSGSKDREQNDDAGRGRGGIPESYHLRKYTAHVNWKGTARRKMSYLQMNAAEGRLGAC